MPLQRRKAKRPVLKTPGGEKLRELRNAAKLSLIDLAVKLEVELGKQIDAGHINKIETGNIKKPQVETLEVILDGLLASYTDRRAVLEAFGYTVPVKLPTEQEIQEAIRLSAYEVHDTATHPVLLVDQSQRLWAWNRYTPRIIGMHPDDPRTKQFIGVTLFDLTFNPEFETRLLIDNPNEYLPSMLQFIKAGTYAFRSEQWYKELIANASAFPEFRSLWERLPTDIFRTIVPIKIYLPECGLLQFRISNGDLFPDPRFRMIHFTPFGAATLRTCAVWAEEEGVL